MPNILLIDDDSTFSALIADWLETGGHTVTLVGNGKLAQIALSENMPDLVISDLYMPEMDGIEFLIALRKLPHTFPVLMISSDDTGRRTRMLSTCEHLGADAILRKPFSQDELLFHVDHLLHNKKMMLDRPDAKQ